MPIPKLWLAIVVALIAVIVLPRLNISTFLRPCSPTASVVRKMTAATASAAEGYKKGEVYFLSHGGPPTMFETSNPAYKTWEKYGRAMSAAKPRGLVVVSAHWENPSGSSAVVVNEDQSNPLVYDFYGFPKEYYTQTFKSRGDSAMLADVKGALSAAGVQAESQKRGLDHGVWVPFKVAFNGSTDIPVVQVSLPGDSSPVSAAKLGRALASLRSKGYGIMGTGQAVHNLRDYMYGADASYGKPFLGAIQTALASKEPLEQTVGLFGHPLYRKAHPSPEHLLPLVVAAAAIEEGDEKEDLYVADNGALGWGMWRWTPPASSAAPPA